MATPEQAAEHRILVVGGSGFVGGHLLRAIRQAMPHAAVTATGIGPSGSDPVGGVSWQQLDVTDRSSVEALIGELHPTMLVHLAALATYRSSALDPDLAWKVNVFGTRHVAEACMARAPDCRFLYVGSGEVYGHACNRFFPVSEDAPLEPGNVYAVTKAAADLTIGEMALRGLDAIRVRPFNHTGPGQGEALFVPAVAAQIARAEAGLQPPVVRVGNLQTARDLLDVRDVVAAYIAILQNWSSLPRGGVLNVASGEAILMRQVLDDLLAMSRVPLTIEQDPARMRPSEVPRVAGDADRIRRYLNWRRQHRLSETLSSVLEDWRGRVGSGRHPAQEASVPAS